MFDRHPQITIDLALERKPEAAHMAPDLYIENLRNELKKAYDLVELNVKQVQADQK